MGNSVKGYVQSKTLWGIGIAFVITVLRMSGVPIPAGTEDIVNSVVLGSLGLGAYGRVTATQKLAFMPGK